MTSRLWTIIGMMRKLSLFWMMRCQSLNLLTVRAKGNKWNTSLVLYKSNDIYYIFRYY